MGQRPLADRTKNRNLRILPADGTIAARVVPPAIRHFPLAAQKQLTSFE